MQAPPRSSVTDPPTDPRQALGAAFPELALKQLPGLLVPEPYRSLLVHDQDMTSTLERFHGESLFLELLSSTLQRQILGRHVLLVGETTGCPRELGAITIYLHRFGPKSAQEILAGRKPLGAILADHHIPYTSCPQGFLELQSTPKILAALRQKDSAKALYGRRNSLFGPAGDLLADVIEILPPLA